MPNIKRKILLCYKGENHLFYKVARSDAQAVVFAIRSLEKELGLMPGALKNYFKYTQNSWEVFLL